MKPVLAIDPGCDGGLAWTTSDGTTHAERMPEGMTAQVDRIREIMIECPGICALLEKVGGYVPGNSGPAAATFARHVGNIEAALYALCIPTQAVAPTVWQRAHGSLPKEKADRKRTIRETMARSFPHLNVTLKTADALGMLVWHQQSGGDR